MCRCGAKAQRGTTRPHVGKIDPGGRNRQTTNVSGIPAGYLQNDFPPRLTVAHKHLILRRVIHRKLASENQALAASRGRGFSGKLCKSAGCVVSREPQKNGSLLR